MSSQQSLSHIKPPERKVQQCRQCMSVYDEALGEAEQGIAPGTAFEALPEHFGCPLCGAGAAMFEEIGEGALGY
nr:rubredoxin [uncultured Chitinophaga sp.]